MKHHIIGTAGHIDHGKTTLIKALTGIETDRLKEEKKRGITIELGFAYIDAPDGEKIGIVDVPGHEKFIKNMLAGAGGVDMVMLVIAADEGVMPQTEEHLNILSLLGAKEGICVLTKADMVEEDWLEMVKEDVREQLQGSFLENAPLLAVSAHTGEGIDALKQEIFDKLANLEEKVDKESFRLPIDRVFTISGFGTVVTGTQIDGKLSVGEEVEIFPTGIVTKVKGIEVHSSAVEFSEAGQRVAVNLANVKKEDLKKGNVIASVGALTTSYVIDVKLKLLDNISRPLRHRSRIRFYYGSAEVLGRVALIEVDELSAGTESYLQLRLEKPVSLKVGDAFVVRYYSPLETIGGGVVLDINPAKHKRFDSEALEDLSLLAEGSELEKLELMLERYSEKLPTVEFLASNSGRMISDVSANIEQLLEDELALAIGKNAYIHTSYFQQLKTKAESILSEFHRKNPLKAGMPKQEFRQKLLAHSDIKVTDLFIELLAKQDLIKLTNNTVASSNFSFELGKKEQQAKEDLEKAILEGAFTPPTQLELLRELPSTIDGKALLLMLIKEGIAVMPDDRLVYHQEYIIKAKEIISDIIAKNQKITLAEFRDAIGASRKYAVALLEYFDSIRFTKKIDDYRVL